MASEKTELNTLPEENAEDEEDDVFIPKEIAPLTIIENEEESSNLCCGLIDLEWLPAKLSFFFVNFKETSYIPFLNLFLIDSGLSPTQSGLITGLRLLGMMVGSPFWGMVADKTSRHGAVMMTLCVVSMMLMIPQPWVPLLLNKGGDCAKNLTSPIPTGGSPNPTGGSAACTQQNDNTLFYVMFFINLVMSFCDGSLIGFVDSSVMLKINQSKRRVDFGKQRFYGAIGFGCGSFVTSLIAEELPSMDISVYSVAFFTYSLAVVGLMISSFFLIRSIDYTQKHDDGDVNVFPIFLSTIKQFRVIFFLLTIFVVGIAHGLNLGFLFLLLKEINTPKIIMGLNILLGAVGSTLMFPFTTKIIQFFKGNMASMGVAAFSYFLRFLSYSYLTIPWTSLLVQILHCFGFALFIAAAVHHTKKISSQEILTTMYGLMNGCHFGAGMLAGNVFGGMIYNEYKGRILYRSAAILLLCWFVLVMVFAIMDWKRSFTGDLPQEDVISRRSSSFKRGQSQTDVEEMIQTRPRNKSIIELMTEQA